ncbi:Uncharacterized protein Fot_19222 [Forsythia ovata]|uniref:Uncharacterized protein n=1 Tax=Forsythia ovata TaxID=205694 RepID=A0ABD1VKR8_9LAMI
MASSRNSNSKTKCKNRYRSNISSQKKPTGCVKHRKRRRRKTDLYDGGRDQQVEDSDDDFLYQCNVRRSPRLKIGHNQVNSINHRNIGRCVDQTAYEVGAPNTNNDGHSCFVNIKSFQSTTHYPSTDHAFNHES